MYVYVSVYVYVIDSALSYNFVINIFIIIILSVTKKVLSYLSVMLSLGHDVLTFGIFGLFAGKYLLVFSLMCAGKGCEIGQLNKGAGSLIIRYETGQEEDDYKGYSTNYQHLNVDLYKELWKLVKVK